MSKSTAARCRAIRYGIRRARHDKRAVANVSEYIVDIRTRPGRTFDYLATVTIGYLFPVIVGIMAPPIYTTAGRAWNREIRRRYVTPELAPAPTAQPEWWKHND